MEKRLLIIDGTAQLYRAFYAIKPLTDPQGRPVNAVFGFAQIVLNLLDKVQPTHGVVVFDTPQPTHRHLLYPEYKAQRQATPEDLKLQIPLVKELLSACQWAVWEQPGWEADDLIGTLARRAAKEHFIVRIYSSDKDLFQLVDSATAILRPMKGGKGDFEELDEAGIQRVFGVRPGQVADMLALMGDASDNIPGVPGIGEKTALGLIQTYGSLQALQASLFELKAAKVREKLEAHWDQAEKSRELVELRIDAPLPFDWETCKLSNALPAPAYALMADFGFKRLTAGHATAIPSQSAKWLENIQTRSDTSGMLNELKTKKMLAVEHLAAGLAIAVDANNTALELLPGNSLEDWIKAGGPWVEALCNPAITKIGYDLKPILAALLRAGKKAAGAWLDLHLAAHLLDLPVTRPSDFIARVLGGAPPESHPEWRTCAWLAMAGSLDERLEQAGARAIYHELELPLLPVLAGMEAEGVAVDRQALESMSAEMGAEMAALEKEIHGEAGVEFNLRSPQQLAEVLFDKLELSPGKRTKTGRSTSVEVLETLAAEHPLPQKILDYRQLQKLKSTYLDVLPGLMDPRDGRVHTTFHQVGAVTGRLSSSDPNLQNIPVRTQRGQRLRCMFVAGAPGHCLLSADYSQIELRLLAHLSQDTRMREDFSQGLDIHRAMAADIFKVPMAAVTPEQRRQAKTCNFGIAYGVSPFGLARQLKISNYQAKNFIDNFYHRYPGVREYLDQTLAQARKQGYVETFLGRRRYLPDLQSANRTIREAAERMAINTPIQGSAADIIKRAMLVVAHELSPGAWKSKMILQVHDELLFEGPETEMPKLKSMLMERMSRVFDLSVELPVEVGWGKNWMEAHA